MTLKSSRTAPAAATQAKLHVRGPARLSYEGRDLKVRRKGLALLYYLALSGPTRREVLADCLWGHAHAARNLRVELHRLRSVFLPLGLEPPGERENPLHLPSGIELEHVPHASEPMEGLEDISPEFQSWLEVKRAQLEARDGPSVREALVRALAADAAPPWLLVLQGNPGPDRLELAQALAQRLKLPLNEGATGGEVGSERAVRYLAEPLPYSRELVERILRDTESLWVLERSSFGEDPRTLLELRSAFPTHRMRYHELPPLTWQEARGSLLHALSFVEAATLYLATGGDYGVLGELLRVRPARGFQGLGPEELPLPQRVGAAYQLEARYLSLAGRLALERAALHPGGLPEGLLDALEVTPALGELERRGWLSWSGVWQFHRDLFRAVTYSGVPRGARAQGHRAAAVWWEAQGRPVEAAYHLRRSGGLLPVTDGAPVDSPGLGPLERVGVGRELALLELGAYGDGAQLEAGTLTLVRTLDYAAPSGAVWELPGERVLLYLTGRVALAPLFGLAAAPLRCC